MQVCWCVCVCVSLCVALSLSLSVSLALSFSQALEQQLMSMNNQLQQLKKEERKLTLEKFLLGFYQIHQKLHNNS